MQNRGNKDGWHSDRLAARRGQQPAPASPEEEGRTPTSPEDDACSVLLPSRFGERTFRSKREAR